MISVSNIVRPFGRSSQLRMDEPKYLFRRNYIMGPLPADRWQGWKELRLSDGLSLAAHPDLEITTAEHGERSVTLLGFILDPQNPSHGNREVLERILQTTSRADEITGELAAKGGRYVLIVKERGHIRVLTDAAGFRQVFHYRDRNQNVWCASQPALIAEQCQLTPSSEVRMDLFGLPLFTDSTEYWFPGNITLYKGLFHLRPNHYLDLDTLRAVRFWPDRRIGRTSLEDAVEAATGILQGLMQAAVSRFRTALAITAGLDTRVVLAACRTIREQIHYFTHTHSRLQEDGADIRIPRTMLTELGLRHQVARHADVVPDDFAALFHRNVTAARERMLINAYAIFRHFQNNDGERLVANGVCSEIARLFYRLPAFFPVNGRVLATLAGMKGSRIAEREFSDWLESAASVCDGELQIPDLFYWENRNANWCAMSYAEYDISFESFSPFNCRRLLETMLSVGARYRTPPIQQLHSHMIARMWPDLLKYPVNPAPTRRDEFVNLLRGTRTYEALRFAKFLCRYCP